MEGAGFPVNSSFFYGSPCTELMFYTQVDSITIVTNTDVKCSLGPGPRALGPPCSPRSPADRRPSTSPLRTGAHRPSRQLLLGKMGTVAAPAPEVPGGICITRRLSAVSASHRGADRGRGSRGRVARGGAVVRAGKLSAPANASSAVCEERVDTGYH